MSSQTPPTLYTPPLSGGSDSEPGSFVLVNPQDGYGNGSLGPGSQEPPTRQESSDVEVDATCHISPAQSNRPQPRPRLNSQSSPVANGSNPEGVGTISMSDITHKINTAASENARLRGRLEENNELLDSKLGQFQHHLETKDEEMARLYLEVSQKQQLKDEVAKLKSELSTSRSEISGLRKRLQGAQEDLDVSHLRQQIIDLQSENEELKQRPVPKPRTSLKVAQTDALRSEVRELKSEKKTLEEEKANLAMKLQTQNVAEKQLNTKIQELEAQMASMSLSTSSYHQLQQEKRDLQAENSRLRSQLEDSQAAVVSKAVDSKGEIQKLQREIGVKESEAQALMNARTQMELKFAELQKRYDAESRAKAELNDKVAVLQRDMNTKARELQYEKQQIAQLEAEVRTLKEQAQTLNDTGEAAKSPVAQNPSRPLWKQPLEFRLNQALGEKKSLEEEVSRLKEENQRYQDCQLEILQIRDDKEALDKEIVQLKEEKERLDRQVREELQMEVKEYQAQLTGLQKEKEAVERALSDQMVQQETQQQQLHQLEESQKFHLAEKDDQIGQLTEKCASYEQIQNQVFEEAQSKQLEIERLTQELERQQREHQSLQDHYSTLKGSLEEAESEKQHLHHQVRQLSVDQEELQKQVKQISNEKTEMGQVLDEYSKEGEAQLQEFAQLQREKVEREQQCEQLQQERDAYIRQIRERDAEIQRRDDEIQRMNDRIHQLQSEETDYEESLVVMRAQLEEYSVGFQSERKAREKQVETKNILERRIGELERERGDLRRRCNEQSATIARLQGSEQFDGTTDLTSSWADISASSGPSPMGPDPRQTFRGSQLNTTFPPQDTMFSPTSPPTQPPGNFPQQSTPVSPRYSDEQPPPRARLLSEVPVQPPRQDIPRGRAFTVTELQSPLGNRQQEHPFAQSDNFGHQFTHGHPQQFQPTPAPLQERAVRFDFPSPPPPPPQQAPNVAMGGGRQLDQAQWVAIDEVDENPPAGACPLCGRDDFKTQTEYLVHCARCDP